MSTGEAGGHAPKRKLTDDEKLEVFMRSFHAMSQKPYWQQMRAQARVDLIGKVQIKLNPDTGELFIENSPLDPMAIDLAGAYMRKLIAGTDLVSFGNLLNILKRKFPRDMHYDEARHIWTQAEQRRFEFLANGDRITTMKLDFPKEWTKGQPRDEGERREVKLSIADFATPYFYTGFLHDLDEDKDTGLRKLTRSLHPAMLERMAHIAIAASLYVAMIAHHIIATGRPDLCNERCEEAAIMARNIASMTDTPESGDEQSGDGK